MPSVNDARTWPGGRRQEEQDPRAAGALAPPSLRHRQRRVNRTVMENRVHVQSFPLALTQAVLMENHFVGFWCLFTWRAPEIFQTSEQ